ncbi:uncharacterized protein Z520_08322 [Fonsecaea multimorphosa CBS 102226]|uniref:RING-type domain-containing protein n=1 Tax=Fonsecaea multimorphosa CBS 102226 TaxID=1442371 RepID=A0A0D2JRK8_9EURO|nr:uncharacterized protein Z520_08322 [Fonsecaea multimorphosa CBS 102226]KIX96067.1 hypothetical protein Z520_08322 [Fonsecaea multimorphosa CBS 102226]OAL21833.1 hypothetical protein AYO22_07775 [Fonsecaea multimorphosa]
MSSPPHYDDYSPSGSQARSERENSSSDDHKYKRRRVEFRSTPHRHMADPSQSPNNSAPTSVPASGDSFGTRFHGMPPFMYRGIFMEEDAALEYLASGSGFAQDLRGIDSPFTYQNYPPTGQPPRPVNLTSYPCPPGLRQESGVDLVRPLPENIFHDHRESDERLGESQGFLVEPSRSVTAAAFGYSVDWSQSSPFPPPVPASTAVSPRREPPSSAAANPQKPPTMLILTRATTESIEALEEHKKECPACQLEFEQDNFMAVITCCDTPMHATCLSAWVNSVTYSKSKACMKCRRTIDARRMLNNVVPPVTDKSWDEGVEFNAPESLKGDAKIELNVSAKPERARMRRFGNSMYYPSYRSVRASFAVPDTLNPETRNAVLQLRDEQLRMTDEMRHRTRVALTECNRANQDDLGANRALLEAQVRGEPGDLTPLIRRCEKTKLARDKAREAYQKIQLESETMARTHANRLSTMLDEYWVEQYRASRSAEDEPARSVPLRVVNGEPSDTRSPEN